MLLQKNIYKIISVIFSLFSVDGHPGFEIASDSIDEAHKYSLDFCEKVDRTIPVHMYSGSFQGRTNAIICHEKLPLKAVCSLTCRIFRISNDLSRFEQTSIIHTVLKTLSLRLKI